MNIATNYNPDPVSGWIKVIADGKDYFVSVSSPLYAKAFDAFKAKDWVSFINAVDPAVKIKSLFAKYETVEVKDGLLFVDGDVVDTVVSERLIQMLSNDVDVLPVLKFVYRLRLNPSARAVNELYTFLEHKCLPLTSSGTFLAYKAVRPDYHDKYSGKFDNSVGNVLEMPRNKVDDDKLAGCSYGFHAGTLEYASGFASQNDKIVLVEIDPADVVSIPVDCEFQKLRTCKYKVVGEFERPLTEPLYESRYETDNDDEVDDYWNDDEYPICSECEEQSYGNCSECNCCEGCCDCQVELKEVQLELNLDNKIQTPWEQINVKVDSLLNHLFKSRRPAIAMAIRRDNKEFDFDEIPYGSLKNYTTNHDAYDIYKEMNP